MQILKQERTSQRPLWPLSGTAACLASLLCVNIGKALASLHRAVTLSHSCTKKIHISTHSSQHRLTRCSCSFQTWALFSAVSLYCKTTEVKVHIKVFAKTAERMWGAIESLFQSSVCTFLFALRYLSKRGTRFLVGKAIGAGWWFYWNGREILSTTSTTISNRSFPTGTVTLFGLSVLQ